MHRAGQHGNGDECKEAKDSREAHFVKSKSTNSRQTDFNFPFRCSSFEKERRIEWKRNSNVLQQWKEMEFEWELELKMEMEMEMELEEKSIELPPFMPFFVSLLIMTVHTLKNQAIVGGTPLLSPASLSFSFISAPRHFELKKKGEGGRKKKKEEK